MKCWLAPLVAMLLTLTACDPAATTSLLVRPTSSTSENLQANIALQQIEIIGTLLEAKGFERRSYGNPQLPLDDSQKRILVKCGHLSYWVRVENHHTMYANTCLSSRGLLVSLVDDLSFTAHPTTKTLANELAAEISISIKDVRVEVIQ